jgi:hypothetical protein
MAAPAIPKKNPSVKWKRTGATGILLNLVTGEYFEVDETALAIWNLIDGKTSAEGMAVKLARSYAAPPERVQKDVVRFLSELGKRNLVETTRPRSR